MSLALHRWPLLLLIIALAPMSPDAAAQAESGLISHARERHYFVAMSIIGSREPFPGAPSSLRFEVPEATISIPMLTRSASHRSAISRLGANAYFNGFLIQPDPFDIHEGPSPDQRVLRGTLPFSLMRSQGATPRNARSETVEVGFTQRVTSSDTVYDEDAALSIPWPRSLPLHIANAARPSPHIPSDHPEVIALLDDWTYGNHRAMPPAYLAKHLAQEILSIARQHGDALAGWPTRDRWRARLREPCDPRSLAPGFGTSNWSSMPESGATTSDRDALIFRAFDIADIRLSAQDRCVSPRVLEPVRTGQANDAVLSTLYASLLRAAGIPSRVIFGVGIDERRYAREQYIPGFRDPPIEIGPSEDVIGIRFQDPEPRFWVEFFLFDDAASSGAWIPVDLGRQRQSSSVPPPIDRPWRYFGNHDDLHRTIPIAVVDADPDAASPDWLPTVWTWETERPFDFFVDAVVNIRVSERVVLPTVP